MPDVMDDVPTFTVTENAVLIAAGIVANVKVAPPSLVVGVMLAEAVDDTVKSLATPVVAPDPSLTVMVHEMLPDTARKGDVGVHASVLAVVGVP